MVVDRFSFLFPDLVVPVLVPVLVLVLVLVPVPVLIVVLVLVPVLVPVIVLVALILLFSYSWYTSLSCRSSSPPSSFFQSLPP